MAETVGGGFAAGMDATWPKGGGSGALMGKGGGQGSGPALYDEAGGDAVAFDVVEKFDVKSGGAVLTEAVEEGSFATYNKVADPLEIGVTLVRMGGPAEFAETLEKLRELKEKAVKVTLSTNMGVYDSMTLESFDHAHSAGSGANLLAVGLVLKEVKEVETAVTTTASAGGGDGGLSGGQCKNPSSASKQGTGKAATESTPEPKKKSMLAGLSGK